VLGAASTTYQGTAHNVGMLWRLGKKAMPTLAVVARDVADTVYKVQKGDGEEQKDLQDLTLGFSVSPELGKWGHLHMMIEGSRLSNDEVTLQKRLRGGFELTFGERYGSDSILALRVGGNSAGASY